MKEVFKYICTGLMLVAYTVSIAGVGVHQCRCADSRQEVLTSGICRCSGCASTTEHKDPSCHTPDGATPAETGCCHAPQPAASTCPASDATGRCCTTLVKALHTDHDITPSFLKMLADGFGLGVAVEPALTVAGGFVPLSESLPDKAPPLFGDTPAWLAFVAQWRL
ncbi:MAG: hypothetical protein LBS12_07655 [Prevotellaceae bacterium]|jgi:hypothetical protein|nr:hypothetical protein [Prevotellaceae bacterium]